MKIMTSTERYCAECGNSEYDNEGDYTHDYEPYDHDFEPDDEGITMQDVKGGLDILGKGFDVWNKYKMATQKPTGFQTNISTTQKDHELHNKLGRVQDSIEIGKKIERKRWIIGIVISSIVAIVIAMIL